MTGQSPRTLILSIDFEQSCVDELASFGIFGIHKVEWQTHMESVFDLRKDLPVPCCASTSILR